MSRQTQVDSCLQQVDVELSCRATGTSTLLIRARREKKMETSRSKQSPSKESPN